jgi:hypothetical protein
LVDSLVDVSESPAEEFGRRATMEGDERLEKSLAEVAVMIMRG